jgi:2-oxoglutarate ferredoxin oxidoreductase subunit alpha
MRSSDKVDGASKSQGMTCIKSSSAKRDAEQIFLLDKEVMDRNIVHLCASLGTDCLHEPEIFRQVDSSSETLLNLLPSFNRQWLFCLVGDGRDKKTGIIHRFGLEDAHVSVSSCFVTVDDNGPNGIFPMPCECVHKLPEKRLFGKKKAVRHDTGEGLVCHEILGQRYGIRHPPRCVLCTEKNAAFRQSVVKPGIRFKREHRGVPVTGNKTPKEGFVGIGHDAELGDPRCEVHLDDMLQHRLFAHRQQLFRNVFGERPQASPQTCGRDNRFSYQLRHKNFTIGCEGTKLAWHITRSPAACKRLGYLGSMDSVDIFDLCLIQNSTFETTLRSGPMTKDKERVLLTGNEAVVEGLCCAAGDKRRIVYAGYPITPASEIATQASVIVPKRGGAFIQMEDEIGSIQAIAGAGVAGAIAVTATSGPGFSLMSEGLGFAAMIESPLVCVNVQRGGPSTGMPTWMGQGDMMQARWGSHGERPVIVLVPDSVQEALYLAYEACKLSQKYLTPVVLMLDEIIGHMEEPISIPDLPPIALNPNCRIIGQGYRIHRTGLTHDLESFLPRINPEMEEKLVWHLLNKVKKDAKKLVKFEAYGTLEDAEIVIVCYGSESRSVKAAVRQARKKKADVAMLRLVTAWPFPKDLVQRLDQDGRVFIVAEINAGQMRVEVERYVKKGSVVGLNLMGGRIHTPDEVSAAIEENLATHH